MPRLTAAVKLAHVTGDGHRGLRTWRMKPRCWAADTAATGGQEYVVFTVIAIVADHPRLSLTVVFPGLVRPRIAGDTEMLWTM